MDSFWSDCKVDLLGKVSKKELEKMLAQIKPVAKCLEYRYRLINTDGVDPKGVAYHWSPTYGKMVRLYKGDFNSQVIPVFSKWGYYGFVKVSLYEVMCAIKNFVPDYSKVRYFWINTDEVKILGDYHFVPTMIFGDEKPEVIDEAWDRDVRKLAAEDERTAKENVV